MKKIGDGYWIYKKYDIYLAEHPKLIGKFEVYKGCEFIKRAYSLLEARKIINNDLIKKQNNENN